MLKHFPELVAAERDWINVADSNGLRREILRDLIDANINSEQILVDIDRHLGVFLPKSQALDFIGQNICRREMRIADRDFKAFVVVASNGAATGCVSSGNPLLKTTAPPIAASGH